MILVKIKITRKQKILFIIICIILMTEVAFITYRVLLKKHSGNVIEEEVYEVREEAMRSDLYNYKITNRATEYEKELFKGLVDVLEEDVISYEDYATYLTKIFVADLFTLKNKRSSSDIRCSQYVYDEYQSTFELMVKESIYSNIELDFDGTREQKLPVVKNIEINSIDREVFTLNDEIIDNEAFKINVSIEYEEDLGYPVSYNVILVNKDKKLQVVKSFE